MGMAARWLKPRWGWARFSVRVGKRRKRLNQLCAASTAHRRGGCRSGSPGGGNGAAALALGGMGGCRPAPPPPPGTKSSATPLAAIATLIALTAAGGAYYLWMELVKVEQMAGRTGGVTQAQLDNSQQTLGARIDKSSAEQQALMSTTRADLEQRLTETTQRNEQSIVTAREQMQAAVDAVRTDLTALQNQQQTDRATLEQAITTAKTDLDAALQKNATDNQAQLAGVQAAVAEAKGAFSEFRDQMNERLAATDQAQTQLRTTVQDAQQELNRTVLQHRIEWALTDIEHLLRAANTQASLQDNVPAALLNLRAAQERMRTLDNPALLPAIEALQNDIQALEEVTLPDITGAAVALSRMARDSLSLPLASDKPAAAPESPPATTTEKIADGAWDTVRGLAAGAWDGFRGLFVVREQGEAAVPLLPPDQTYFLQQNLRLQLDTARLALLRQDDAAYHETLSNAEAWVNKYYAKQELTVQAYLAALRELQTLKLDTTVPDISGSLQALQQAAAAILGAPRG